MWEDGVARKQELADGAAAEGVDDGGDGFLQQFGIGGHIAAVVGFVVEEGAECLVRRGFPGAEDAVDVEGLLRLGEGEADVPVVADINEEVGLEGIDGFAAIGVAGLLETEDERRAR